MKNGTDYVVPMLRAQAMVNLADNAFRLGDQKRGLEAILDASAALKVVYASVEEFGCLNPCNGQGVP